jgi:hypothetical protein
MGTTTPDWLGAAPGSPGLAGQVNQFLGDHNSVITYGEVQASTQGTGAAVYTGTDTSYLAQLITTAPAQTSISSVAIQLSTVGGSPVINNIPNLTISIFDSFSGAPTGAALTSVTLTETYIYSSPFWVSVPLTLGGLTGGTDYFIVTSMVGTSTNLYVWQRSTQTTGAFTSTDEVSWIPATYGLMYQVNEPGGSSTTVKQINEDDGARTTQFSYDADDQLISLVQFTATQGGSGSFLTAPTFTYTNGLITGVS